MASHSLEKRNEKIGGRIIDISDVKICHDPTSFHWMKLVGFTFKQEGRNVNWKLVRTADSVNIVVFNVSRKKLVFVRQFRPAVYCVHVAKDVKGNVDVEKYPPSLGLTIELCGGIVEKNKSLAEIAQNELLEECGYQAPITDFQQIISYRQIGLLISTQTLFYIEVTDEMKTHPGGGLPEEGEMTEVVEMNVDEVKEYMTSKIVQSPPSFLNGINWFLLNKKDCYA